VTDAQGRFRLFLERDVEYTVHVFAAASTPARSSA
jgi:hypothetical protein